jgi:hypothetical protein
MKHPGHMFGGFVSTISKQGMTGRPEEEERANIWGPHISDREERRRCGPKAQTQEGNIFRWGRQGCTGLPGWLGEATAWEGE